MNWAHDSTRNSRNASPSSTATGDKFIAPLCSRRAARDRTLFDADEYCRAHVTRGAASEQAEATAFHAQRLDQFDYGPETRRRLRMAIDQAASQRVHLLDRESRRAAEP